MLGIIVLGGAAAPATAAEEASSSGVMCPICAKANDEASDYRTKAGHTLLRGTTNALLGWTELFRRPVDEVKAGGNVLAGMGKGVGQGVRRTLAGAGEVLTFWTPKTKDGYVRFSKDCPVCMGNR
jgi:putative exosortase-associated protein (TIGR04073 family)